MHLYAYIRLKKCPLLLAAVRATLRHTFVYLLCYIYQFFQKGLTIDAIEHMSILFFAYQDTGLLHKVQMSGDNRPVLGHIFRYAPDISPSV